MTEFGEYIATEVEDMDAWLCICGNRPDHYGFYPCDRDGNEMEPVEVRASTVIDGDGLPADHAQRWSGGDGHRKA